ncbi:MAG: hypothetical protein WD906_01875 [Anaerolineales bacterium]
MPVPHALSRARQIHQEKILSKPNVVGVGVGLKSRSGRATGELALIALVRRKVPEAALAPQDLVPSEADGVPTDVMEVGYLRALVARTDRARPAPGGVSIGHYQVTAGTLGAVVRDRTTGRRLILSNNHVLANNNAASPGDAILQPGAIDGGRDPLDRIAQLERFAPIAFVEEPSSCGVANAVVVIGNSIAMALGSKHRLSAHRYDPQATNRVDAALALPIDDGAVSDEILDIGVPAGTTSAELAMRVRKSGRSSGFTTGEVTVIDATVTVGYGEKSARFEGQIVSGPMSQPGDSGSLVMSADSLLAVGLLFAGSQQATIFNPIDAVVNALGIVI